jgi:hypothetical protein
MSAKALLAKGLKPLWLTNNPLLVKRPHLNSSRLVISPFERAATISARFFLASSASFWRLFDASRDKNIDITIHLSNVMLLKMKTDFLYRMFTFAFRRL